MSDFAPPPMLSTSDDDDDDHGDPFGLPPEMPTDLQDDDDLDDDVNGFGMPPDMPNNISDGMDDDGFGMPPDMRDDDGEEERGNSYDLTGLSDKLHCIPSDILHDVPRDILEEKRRRDNTDPGGKNNIVLNGIGVPFMTKKSPDRSPSPSSLGTEECPSPTPNATDSALPGTEEEHDDFEKKDIAEEEQSVNHINDLEENEANVAKPLEANCATSIECVVNPTEEPSVTPIECENEKETLSEKGDDFASGDSEIENVDDTVPIQNSPSPVAEASSSPLPETTPAPEPVQVPEELKFPEPVPTLQKSPSPVEASSEDDEFGDFDSAFPTTAAASSAETKEKPTAVQEIEEAVQEADDDDFGDFADFSQAPQPAAAPVRTPEAETVSPKQPSIASISSILESFRPTLPSVIKTLYLHSDDSADENNNVTRSALNPDSDDDPVWSKIKSVQDTPALTMTWAKSKANKKWLAFLKMDPNNIVFRSRMSSPNSGNVPAFASGLSASSGGLLEPTKVPEHSRPRSTSPKLDLSQQQQSQDSSATTRASSSMAIIPDAQFDWQDSGLTNPLDANNDVERSPQHLSSQSSEVRSPSAARFSPASSDSHPPKAPPRTTPPNGVGGAGLAAAPRSSSSKSQPQYSSSQKARSIVDSFPLLNFMQAASIRFPGNS